MIRESDILSGIANKQLAFIALLLLLVFIAIIAMLVCIIIQYKPISNLAAEMAGKSSDGTVDKSVIDERVLLSNTIATLKNDSEQKLKAAPMSLLFPIAASA